MAQSNATNAPGDSAWIVATLKLSRNGLLGGYSRIVGFTEVIFLHNDCKEYHLPVAWKVVLSENQAAHNSEASAIGYSLPVRSVFGRLHRGRLANQLELLMKKRANEEIIEQTQGVKSGKE